MARQKKGFREGRKPTPKVKLEHAMEMQKSPSYTQVVEMTDISKNVLIRETRRRKKDELAGKEIELVKKSLPLMGKQP